MILNVNMLFDFFQFYVPVKTISATDNIKKWLEYWFKIFKRKADKFLKNSERILKEIEEDWKKFETYTTYMPGFPKNIDYTPYLKNFDEF